MRSFIRASFYRGGTSKAIIFDREALPANKQLWDNVFLHAMGSPDAYGRQLNGMGGGLSSLSKVVVVNPSEQPGVDLDYTFYQISVDDRVVDDGAMCGNMAASVGPFAIEHNLVPNPDNGTVKLRILNTNTDKLYEIDFSVKDGQVVENGDLIIPGVSGSGAPIGLTFRDPAGSRTGRLLPTGQARDTLTLANGDKINASLVDATNPVVFVLASDLGVMGNESVETLENDSALMQRLESIRCAASVAMGLSSTYQNTRPANPKVALIAPPLAYTASNGEHFGDADMDVTVRIVSMGKLHRAVTLTGGMCLAAGLIQPDFILESIRRANNQIRIAHPSGVFPVSLSATADHAIESLTCYRTQRCLFRGELPIPTSLLAG